MNAEPTDRNIIFVVMGVGCIAVLLVFIVGVLWLLGATAADRGDVDSVTACVTHGGQWVAGSYGTPSSCKR